MLPACGRRGGVATPGPVPYRAGTMLDHGVWCAAFGLHRRDSNPHGSGVSMRRAFPITLFLLAVVLQACQLKDAAGPLSRRPSADRRSDKVETVVPSDASIAGIGATQQFDATALSSEGDRAAGNARVHWESSNPWVATVDDNGLATATGVGQTAITARARGITGTATLTVTGAPSRLAFTVQPSDAAGASPIAPAIRVAVQDEFGTTLGSATTAVTFAVASHTSRAALSGATTGSGMHR